MLSARVYGCEVYLIVVGAKLYKEIYYLVGHLVEVAASVYFVDGDYRFFAQPERLFEHVTRLRHATLYGVNEQYYAVHHGQYALYLSAEVRVSGCVDDIDFHVLIVQSGALGEYGNSALALEIARVHYALRHNFARAEYLVLLEQLIYQRGLAVVYVRDYRHVSDIGSFHIYTSVKV